MLAQYYQFIYLIVISILTLIEIKRVNSVKYKEQILPSVVLFLMLSLWIGFRPHSYVFGDTINYVNGWGMVHWEGIQWSNVSNKIFDNLYNWMGTIFPNATILFVIMSGLYFGFILVSCKKLFPNHVLLAFLVYLAAFSTFSYGTNGIKAGVAASLFIAALAYRDNVKSSVILLLISWGFHHSMQLPVAAYIVTFLYRESKWYFYGWVFCLFIAVLHISFFQNLFASMTDESGASYLNAATETIEVTIKGFRIDFVLYSAMPVVVGYYVVYVYKLRDPLYETMLHVYLLCNSVWMLCMYASFTNRIAYLSWFLYPILIVYPCFKIKNLEHPLVKNRNVFVLCHLGFTLFMNLIYY